MKTSELTGKALDFAVAKASQPVYSDEALIAAVTGTHKGLGYTYSAFTPSTNAQQGHHIIERERIGVMPNLSGSWLGRIRHEVSHPMVAHKVLAGWTNQHGPTYLIAAMRCFVATKLGPEVEIPKELL